MQTVTRGLPVEDFATDPEGIGVYYQTPRVEIPDVIGMEFEEAEEEILKAGFEIDVKLVNSDEPEDTVVAVTPEPGERFNWHLFHVLVGTDVDRDAVTASMRERGVGTAAHWTGPADWFADWLNVPPYEVAGNSEVAAVVCDRLKACTRPPPFACFRGRSSSRSRRPRSAGGWSCGRACS